MTNTAPITGFAPAWAGQFDTFADWVNNATAALAGRKGSQLEPLDAVCIDAKGRRCNCGSDFMRARDEGTFPVRYFWTFEAAPVAPPRTEQLTPGELVAELCARLEDAGTSGDGGELAAYVMGAMADYFSSEALLSALADRAGTDSSALVQTIPTRALCEEVCTRIVSKYTTDHEAGETASAVLGDHVTLTPDQLKEQFKASELALSDLFPDAAAELERAADGMADVLRHAAALVYDCDFSALADLRRGLERVGVSGPYAVQVPDAGDITAPLFG